MITVTSRFRIVGCKLSASRAGSPYCCNPLYIQTTDHRAAPAPGAPSGPEGSARFPQRPHEHPTESPVLLAVDQQVGCAALRIAPGLSDPLSALEVGRLFLERDFGIISEAPPNGSFADIVA
jgi:hypothetical protein